ncbi:MAG: DNA mismatch repair protein MutS [Defluviitaleaceae bacterium]|nr:DNA mismatch repair protein MutS [Defluviitaleaceae bacterium]
MNHFKTLEFDTILEKLSEYAVSDIAKERCRALMPSASIEEATRLANQTTEARNVIEQAGNPPISAMTNLEKVIALLGINAMLTIDDIENVESFLASCKRMKSYLKNAEATGADIAFYGHSVADLTEMEEEIARCLRNGQIDDRATTKLHDLRRGIERKSEQIKAKIEALMKVNKQYCVDGFVAMRNGRYTMPVQKKFKNKVPGVLVEISNTGGTCFIEPTSVAKMRDELDALKIEEENEVRIVLYALTALISDNLEPIKTNMEAMEVLDFVFAKAKLSLSMDATQIRLTQEREVRLISARHPLLEKGDKPPVPLNFALGGGIKGIVITGPNTGGKTVAIKTVGLVSLMAQSGLHVPADQSSSVCVFDAVWCDIGDGQSISQNLSTFSSHMTNIIDVLEKTTPNSLILFDELGSGTDPAEGMGIATAILEELLAKNCLFAATTHYPEIKDFAARTDGIINARMAFDRESLMPLYKLEIGEAGESCALHIAEKLGIPTHILNRARQIAYSGGETIFKSERKENGIIEVTALEIDDEPEEEKPIPRSQRFNVGDSVTVYPQRDIGIVYKRDNGKGEIMVQIKGEKHLINHKRIKLKVAASELYPDDYDFSIVFDTVENRKARHLMSKRHVAEKVIVTTEP